jgi:hypothetical protein
MVRDESHSFQISTSKADSKLAKPQRARHAEPEERGLSTSIVIVRCEPHWGGMLKLISATHKYHNGSHSEEGHFGSASRILEGMAKT